MGGERPRPRVYRAHPNTAATEGEAAILIHFAAYKLSRNAVINCCQAGCEMADCEADLGGVPASALGLCWQHRSKAFSLHSSWRAASTWLALILRPWEPGKIHLQLCRCDLLGENVMGDSSDSLCGCSSAVRQSGPPTCRVFDDGFHQGFGGVVGLFREFYISALTESINDYVHVSGSCDSECGRSAY